MPPSVQALRERLIDRKADTMETIEKRVAIAEKEIGMAQSSGIFHRIVINDDKDKFLSEAVSYIVKDLYKL